MRLVANNLLRQLNNSSLTSESTEHIHFLRLKEWKYFNLIHIVAKIPTVLVMSILFSVCSSIHRSICEFLSPTGRISVKFDTGWFYKFFLKIQMPLKSVKLLGNSRENLSNIYTSRQH